MKNALTIFISSKKEKDDTVYLLKKNVNKLNNILHIERNEFECVNEYCDDLKSLVTNSLNKLVVCHSEPFEHNPNSRKYIWDLDESIISPDWFICPQKKGGLLVLFACYGHLIVENTPWEKKYDKIITFKSAIIFNFDTLSIRYGIRRFIRKLIKELNKPNSGDFIDRFNNLIESEIRRNMFLIKYCFLTNLDFLNFTLQSLKTHQKQF